MAGTPRFDPDSLRPLPRLRLTRRHTSRGSTPGTPGRKPNPADYHRPGGGRLLESRRKGWRKRRRGSRVDTGGGAAVGNVRNDGPELVAPAAESGW